MALCIVAADSTRLQSIDLWTVVDLVDGSGQRLTVVKALIAFLWEHHDVLSTCDVAVVEKQLASKNYKATRLAYCIIDWFEIVCPHVPVVHYHAFHKTAHFAPPGFKFKSKYERKMYCVSLAIEILTAAAAAAAENETADAAAGGLDAQLASFMAAKKKDDLADTLCQALAYLDFKLGECRSPSPPGTVSAA
jgi:hypothetical protein